jgi:hypothetical protein
VVEASVCKTDLSGFESRRYLQFYWSCGVPSAQMSPARLPVPPFGRGDRIPQSVASSIPADKTGNEMGVESLALPSIADRAAVIEDQSRILVGVS